jgi:hypothetical protein
MKLALALLLRDYAGAPQQVLVAANKQTMLTPSGGAPGGINADAKRYLTMES